jgi:PTH1 family peptidyl-tRNA hydrolase
MAHISTLFGLGNPGKRYRDTRHNLGSGTLDLLAERRGLKWTRGDGPYFESRWRFAAREIRLVKSRVYMNVSGCILDHVPVGGASELLVICDDLSLPLGRLRIRQQGGSGGHLGLESVITSLGTEAFLRMRLGIGTPPPGIEWSEFVLLPFLDEEREIVRGMLETAVDAIEAIARDGVEHAMQIYNRRVSAEDGNPDAAG